jgi:predicted MFS family arabinose efflux permease
MVKMQPITAHLSIQRDKKAITHLAHTVAKRNYRIGFLTTALLSMGGFFIMPFGSSFAVNNLHVSQGDLKILFMVAGISSLFIMPIVGRLSDKIDKFAIFAVASVWMMIAVWVYTNLGPTPFWLVICLNIVMMMGIMSRMVPATALITGIPDMADRGAFMSINSSLQQMAGGIAATVGGKILVQKTKTSPLEHFDTLGYLVIIFAIVCVVMLYRVSNVIKKKTAEVKI